MTSGNAALASTQESGAPVYLFYLTGRVYHYVGRALVEAVRQDTAVDADGIPRFVYNFELRLTPKTQVWKTESLASDDKNQSVPSTSGLVTFRPKARLVRALLGRELVSNELVAILELVKNSYDADASRVTVRITPEEDLVEVSDNGHGMTLETVKTAWIEPATNSKVKSSRSKVRQRRVLGNKGVGRFAASRLGNRLHLVTLASPEVFPEAPKEEVHVDLEWSQFDDPEVFLDEIEFHWSTVSPTEPIVTGTSLQIRRLASDVAWTRDRIEELRLLLARLVSPFHQVNDFEIIVKTPYPDLDGPVLSLPMLSQPHYTIKGKVDTKGFCRLVFSAHNSPQALEVTKQLNPSHISAGPFEIELRAWNQEEEELRNLATSASVDQIKRSLAKAAGVSIYRDGFRVLPYGEAKNDWLRLDMRRVQNPTLRLSNNQIVGAIFLTGDNNPLIVDQSNREGLIENKAVDDLRLALIEILTELETRRYQGKRQPKQNQDLPPSVSHSLEDIRQALLQRYPHDKDLISQVETKQVEIAKQVELVTRSVVQYRRLSTLGRLIDMILHDGRSPLNIIKAQATVGDFRARNQPIECKDDQLTTSLSMIIKYGDSLSRLFRKLEPLGGRDRRKAQNCVLETVIGDTVAIYEHSLAAAGVKVTVPSSSTNAYVDSSELQQVIVNLVDNSLYWLKTTQRDDREIRFDVEHDGPTIKLLVFDSGPGVSSDDIDYIFDAYYSTKPAEAEGKGLGLFIAAEILRENEGSLELIEGGPLSGACFLIRLKAGQPD